MNTLIPELEILSTFDKDKSKKSVSNTNNQKLFIESYGCQMNFSDSEIVCSILEKEGFATTNDFSNADIILLNTCSIREKAELTVRKRLTEFNKLKIKKPDTIIGILGCMAERLKSKLLEEEKIVDLVVGPDAYRDLPNLIKNVESGNKSVNTLLSREETYADISPLRFNSNGVSAFISIMRGCDNMCSFCVVPFTRGRERSRSPQTIINEAKQIFERGYREVTLLGQNVDSYKWSEVENNKARLEKKEDIPITNFAQLLEMVAQIHPDLRVRFSTSHPKDITDEVLYIMKKYENICKYIHFPAQSGSSRILELMNRTYNREYYMQRIVAIKSILGEECGISSDFITGFCTETDEDHKQTLSLMDFVQYDFSYMFYYSERPNTPAAKKLNDDISLDIKKKRLSEIIAKQQELSLLRNQIDVGKIFKILVEGVSKRSKDFLQGRNSANKVVVFKNKNIKKGQYVNVKIEECTGGTLLGTLI